jgi:hypothetical protein
MVNLSAEAADLARNVAYWEPRLNLSRFVEQAIRREADRLAKKRGKPYAPRRADLEAGRPMER